MTRFFAHLCLYLQMIDVSAPPLATQVILEAYLQVLEVFLHSHASPALHIVTHFTLSRRQDNAS